MSTIHDEGVRALYRGITPTFMGAMPYEGIKFGTVGVLERAFPSSDTGKPDPIRKMMYGGLGGVMAGLITYPNGTQFAGFCSYKEVEGLRRNMLDTGTASDKPTKVKGLPASIVASLSMWFVWHPTLPSNLDRTNFSNNGPLRTSSRCLTPTDKKR